MNVDSLPETLQDSIQDAEPGVVLPTVDVVDMQIQDSLFEAVDGELCETGFASSRWSCDNQRLCRLPIGKRAEDSLDVLNFCISMDDLCGNKVVT